MNNQHINEQSNLSASFAENLGFGSDFASYVESGSRSMASILRECNASLVFTREYEHALGCLSQDGGNLAVSFFRVPHPSGIAVVDGKVFVMSTRTPHLLYEFTKRGSVISGDERTYLIPCHIQVLPGSLYAHELVAGTSCLYFNSTGTNEIQSISFSLRDSPSVYFRPRFMDSGSANCMQINSIAIVKNLPRFATCFCDQVCDYKPWKDESGPLRRGAIIRLSDGHSVVRGLTCPHSVRFKDDRLFFCDSGFGAVEACNPNGSDRCRLATLPGFTRGLAFAGKFIFIGLSRVQPERLSYAPGVDPLTSKCGIAVLDTVSHDVVSMIEWPYGAQLFDIQILPARDFARPCFPQSRPSADADPSDLFYRWRELF